MKLVLIGAGGFRTPAMYAALADAAGELGLRELVLHDVARARLQRIEAVLRGLEAERGAALPFRSTDDVDDALEGADFVFCAIRVGGLDGRLVDETVPLELGLLGQETVGAGGLAYALRTLPVMTSLAERVAERAPSAWFLNYTNPAALVTEALVPVLGGRVVGVCDSPVALTHGVARALDRDPGALTFDYGGLNHLGWLKAVVHDGRDLLPELLADDGRLTAVPEGRIFGPELLRSLGRIPSEYLAYYYFTREIVASLRAGGTRAAALRDQQAEFYGADGGSPAEALARWRAAVRRRSASYMDEVHRATGAPTGTEDDVPADGGLGGYTAVAIAAVRALVTGAPAVLYLNTVNRGAIPFLDDAAVVEVACSVDAGGVRPLATSGWTLHEQGLISLVKDAERAAIEAAATGSPARAVRALALHPLVGSLPTAKTLFDRYRAALPELRDHFGGAT
jgi:6-phospho-beta-glucosidase